MKSWNVPPIILEQWLDHVIHCQSSRVQLMMSQDQARCFVQCHVNRGGMMGLLLIYPVEAKECWTNLLNMHPILLHWMWFEPVFSGLTKDNSNQISLVMIRYTCDTKDQKCQISNPSSPRYFKNGISHLSGTCITPHSNSNIICALVWSHSVSFLLNILKGKK